MKDLAKKIKNMNCQEMFINSATPKSSKIDIKQRGLGGKDGKEIEFEA